jgi:hypothetical protein
MKTSIQYLYLVIVNILLTTFVYGQDQLDSLQSVRKMQALNNENHLTIDNELVNLGHKPKALCFLNESNLEKEFHFLTYKNYSEEKLEFIYSRLQAMFPELITISINGNNVLATFTKETSEESLITFFRFFGYHNYELLSH